MYSGSKQAYTVGTLLKSFCSLGRVEAAGWLGWNTGSRTCQHSGCGIGWGHFQVQHEEGVGHYWTVDRPSLEVQTRLYHSSRDIIKGFQ